MRGWRPARQARLPVATVAALGALAAVVAGRVLVAWGSEAASYHASAAVKTELRHCLLARAIELGPRWLAGQRGAELTALATEGIEALDGYFARYLPQLILAAVVPVAVVARVGWAAPDQVSAVILAGKITVLAGPSGSGKSTLLDVLLGFAGPSAGQVLIGGADLAELRLTQLDKEAWRAQLAWVPQQPYLFPGTVASNIRLGWPDAPDEAIEAAARAAALDEVPLDRQVTERGGGLSSGERRRVALARALLPGRPVLLLDEPTAGLDAETEARVLDSLRGQATAGRIVLIAAHHPRVLAAADRVIRLGESAPAETSRAEVLV